MPRPRRRWPRRPTGCAASASSRSRPRRARPAHPADLCERPRHDGGGIPRPIRTRWPARSRCASSPPRPGPGTSWLRRLRTRTCRTRPPSEVLGPARGGRPDRRRGRSPRTGWSRGSSGGTCPAGAAARAAAPRVSTRDQIDAALEHGRPRMTSWQRPGAGRRKQRWSMRGLEPRGALPPAGRGARRAGVRHRRIVAVCSASCSADRQTTERRRRRRSAWSATAGRCLTRPVPRHTLQSRGFPATLVRYETSSEPESTLGIDEVLIDYDRLTGRMISSQPLRAVIPIGVVISPCCVADPLECALRRVDRSATWWMGFSRRWCWPDSSSWSSWSLSALWSSLVRCTALPRRQCLGRTSGTARPARQSTSLERRQTAGGSAGPTTRPSRRPRRRRTAATLQAKAETADGVRARRPGGGGRGGASATRPSCGSSGGARAPGAAAGRSRGAAGRRDPRAGGQGAAPRRAEGRAQELSARRWPRPRPSSSRPWSGSPG